jgi:hypothetical protein
MCWSIRQVAASTLKKNSEVIMASRWMQHEAEREKRAGTRGSFTRIAEQHGRSVHAEAEHDKHKSGKIGKKARMTLAFASAKH